MTVEPDQKKGVDGACRVALTETVYSHLRAIAQHQLNGERAGHSLSATALVHEAYMRLERSPGAPIPGRKQFVFAAAEAMRRILIEHARAHGRHKRGGGVVRVSLEAIGDVADLHRVSGEDAESVFAFDDAFRRLEEHDADVADVVRLRFFAGLSGREAARALGVSPRTVDSRWAYARGWMAREITRHEAGTAGVAAGRMSSDGEPGTR